MRTMIARYLMMGALFSSNLMMLNAHGYEEKLPTYFTFKSAATPYSMTAKDLYAIALAESGHWHKNGRFLPHPYAISLGKDTKRGIYQHQGYFPETLVEARKVLRNLLNAGFENIGIGMMQVNIKANPNIVDDYFDLLDPHQNLAAATKVIEWCRQDRAPEDVFACYAHGKINSTKGEAYASRVTDYITRFGFDWQQEALTIHTGEISFDQFLIIARQRANTEPPSQPPQPIQIIN